MCRHLKALEEDLLARGIPITFRGKAWSHQCREWVYFTCYFDIATLRRRLKLEECIVEHVNEDSHTGEERGLVCTECNDAIIGRLKPSNDWPTVG